MAQEPTRTFVRTLVQGVVYLVEPTTGRTYTYDLERPVFMGQVRREGEGLRLQLRADHRALTERECERRGLQHVLAAMRTLSSP